MVRGNREAPGEETRRLSAARLCRSSYAASWHCSRRAILCFSNDRDPAEMMSACPY